MGTTRTALFSRAQSGGMFAIESQDVTTGARWFVDSNSTGGADAAGYGRSPDAPFLTLGYAFSSDLVNANVGDIVYLMPGHVEAITSATACVLDRAGIKIRGLGWGTLIPKLHVTTADTATLSITAANIWIDNVRIISNFLNIASAVTVGGLADGLTLTNCYMGDTSIILGALIGISVAADCDDVIIKNFRYVQTALTGPATNCIVFAGGSDRLYLEDCFFDGACTGAVVAASAAASTDVCLKNITVMNSDTTNGLGFAFHNSSTGFVEDFRSVNLKNTVKGITGTGLSIGQNCVYSNAVNAYAGLFNYTIDS